jgi:serine protease Do
LGGASHYPDIQGGFPQEAPMNIFTALAKAGPIFLLLFFSCTCFALDPPASSSTASFKESVTPLLQLNNSVESLVKRVSPSVVQIVVSGFRPIEESIHGQTGFVIGKQKGLGSGAIISSDGYILTNAHVVIGSRKVQVILPNLTTTTNTELEQLAWSGRTLDANVVGTSPELDLALLKVNAQGLLALTIGDYGKVQQGEMVFAFGSPSGLRNTVTMGVVSAVARQLDPDSPLVFIQTDAPINPGNSGGPLVNVNGELVGINTFILTQSGGNEGLGFAIPSAILRFAYPQLRQYGHLHRGVMGIKVQAVTPAIAAGLSLSRDWGVIIADVLPDSPGETAGLKIQDIIISMNGKHIDSLPIFGINLFTINPGEKIKLEALRGTEKLSFEVPVIEQKREVDRLQDMADPEANLIKKLGVIGLEIDAKVLELVSDLRLDAGVMVVGRMFSSDELENNLMAGDVIHAVNGLAISGLKDLNEALDAVKSPKPTVLQIEREGKFSYLTIQME